MAPQASASRLPHRTPQNARLGVGRRAAMLVPDDAAYPTLTLVSGGAAQVVGRKHGALVLQTSSKVSKVHCQLWMSADGVAFVSESSANGTWINDVRMKKDLEYALKPGDRVSFPAPPGVTMPILTFTLAPAGATAAGATAAGATAAAATAAATAAAGAADEHEDEDMCAAGSDADDDEDIWDPPVGPSSPAAGATGSAAAASQAPAGVGAGAAATCTCPERKQLKCWVCPIYGRCAPREVDEALKKLGAFHEAEDYTSRLLRLLRIERSQVGQGGRGGQCGAVLEGKGRVRVRVKVSVSVCTSCAPGDESALGGNGRAPEAITDRNRAGARAASAQTDL